MGGVVSSYLLFRFGFDLADDRFIFIVSSFAAFTSSLIATMRSQNTTVNLFSFSTKDQYSKILLRPFP